MPKKSKKSQKNVHDTDSSTDDPKKKQNKKQMEYILAAMYFLDWNKSLLEAYTHNIKELYLVPLTEHCLRKKVMLEEALSMDFSGKSSKVIAAGKKLEQGVKVELGNDELQNLQRRLRNEYEVQKETQAEDPDYVPVKKERWTSLAEISVMYRLRTLIQMSGSTLIFMTKTRSWLEKHRKLLGQHPKECGEVLDYTLLCFETICCQADIFSLTPVDRSIIRSDCKGYITMDDPYVGDPDRKRDEPLVLKENIKEKAKRLESQINYYRSSVNTIASSLIDITQAIAKKIPRNALAVTTKDVKMILERLPPAYYFPTKIVFSEGTQKLLERHPPNKRRIIQQDDRAAAKSESSKTVSKKSVVKSVKSKKSVVSEKKSVKSEKPSSAKETQDKTPSNVNSPNE
ncbi:unnamed protein product [Bursaphelenchus okinawaensis]|uniref:Uncharacterized protein n=1 Tax=Bursaphelenchus okinawaensis TaxID=465554 RepID=A0A811K884_9BILA|nr:unnamed protein product [Bursaphelenchus okinawaensis]CAG9094777.1 unnamed protein product [Bursaphelenchus okinawaensis]